MPELRGASAAVRGAEPRALTIRLIFHLVCFCFTGAGCSMVAAEGSTEGSTQGSTEGSIMEIFASFRITGSMVAAEGSTEGSTQGSTQGSTEGSMVEARVTEQVAGARAGQTRAPA